MKNGISTISTGAGFSSINSMSLLISRIERSFDNNGLVIISPDLETKTQEKKHYQPIPPTKKTSSKHLQQDLQTRLPKENHPEKKKHTPLKINMEPEVMKVWGSDDVPFQISVIFR